MAVKTKLSMTIPTGLKNNMRRLRTAAGHKIVRNSLRAAGRPALRVLRKEVRLLRASSDQSSGATHRSLKGKTTFPSKRLKGYGYMYAGVDMQHEEEHQANTSRTSAAFGARNKGSRKTVRNDQFIGFTNRLRRQVKGRPRVRKRLVRSYQKTPLRKRKGATKQLNKPWKIWHLLESGFTHRSGTRFKGYKFEERARAAATNDAVTAFDRVLSSGIERELSKT